MKLNLCYLTAYLRVIFEDSDYYTVSGERNPGAPQEVRKSTLGKSFHLCYSQASSITQ